MKSIPQRKNVVEPICSDPGYEKYEEEYHWAQTVPEIINIMNYIWLTWVQRLILTKVEKTKKVYIYQMWRVESSCGQDIACPECRNKICIPVFNLEDIQ